MERVELLDFLRQLRKLFGQSYLDFQVGVNSLSAFSVSVVEVAQDRDALLRVSDLERFLDVCNKLSAELVGRTSDKIRRSMSSLPVAQQLGSVAMGDLSWSDCAPILSMLPGGLEDGKFFKSNASGSNLQWHLINVGFGDLIVLEPVILNKSFVELIEWLGDRLLDIANKAGVVLEAACRDSGGVLANETSGLVARANFLTQKLFDLFRLVQFMVTEPGDVRVFIK